MSEPISGVTVVKHEDLIEFFEVQRPTGIAIDLRKSTPRPRRRRQRRS